MKYTIPFLLLFALGCQEEIIGPERIVYDTITKIDTVYCPCVSDTVWRVDTVWVNTVRTEYDTLLRIIIDSVMVYDTIIQVVTETEILYDTIEIVRHHYMDTLVQFESDRVLEIWGEWQDIVEDFYRVSIAYGRSESLGGNGIIEMWTADEAPPSNRSAYSYFIYDQYMVKLKESLTHDEAYTPLFREFARRVFGKKYDAEGSGGIMDPSLPPGTLKFSSSDAQKKPYLDELFGHTGI